MTVVGSDQFADAPLLEVGFSSAYTPNAGYTTEVGEPTAWGGKTAWWRVEPTLTEFHYIDVLYSTGSTRAWVYRSFVPDPDLSDLNLVNDPGADNQGGWNAQAGGLYFIRLDSDGSDVSYVASVGVTMYDEIRERRFIHGPAPEDVTFPWHVREDYFVPGAIKSPITNPDVAAYYALVDDNVSGAPGGTAVMHVGNFADDVTAADPSWYASGGGHPTLAFSSSSVGGDTVTIPTGYDVADAPIYVTMASTAGPALEAEPDGEVIGLSLTGDLQPGGNLRYFDENGGVAGDVEVGAMAEFRFEIPVGFAPDTAVTDYNSGELVFTLSPNPAGSGVDPEPYPVGSWSVSTVEIEFLFTSDEPLPYEPPPPPGVVSYVRQFPVDHPYAWGGSPRTYPPSKANRVIGGYQ